MLELAVVAWTLTALGGVGLAFIWSRASKVERARTHVAEPANGGITVGILAPHATLAVGGLLIWGAAATAPEGEAGTPGRLLALVMLTVGMVIGVAMVRRWSGARTHGGPDAAVPGAAVAAHGLLALVTLGIAVAATIAAV